MRIHGFTARQILAPKCGPRSTTQVGLRIQSEKLTNPSVDPVHYRSWIEDPVREADKPKCGPCPLSKLDRKIPSEKLTNPSVDPVHYPSWIKRSHQRSWQTQVWTLSTIRVVSKDPVREDDKPKCGPCPLSELDRRIQSEKLKNPSVDPVHYPSTREPTALSRLPAGRAWCRAQL